MPYEITFEHLLNFDSGKQGIALPVTLKIGDQTVDLDAKLDTGATYCIFQRFYGEELGLAVEAGELLEFSTATGGFQAYGHLLTVSLAEMDFESLVYFAKDHFFNRNVIGRIGFLNRVRLGLDDYSGKLYLGLNGTKEA